MCFHSWSWLQNFHSLYCTTIHINCKKYCRQGPFECSSYLGHYLLPYRNYWWYSICILSLLIQHSSSIQSALPPEHSLPQSGQQEQRQRHFQSYPPTHCHYKN